MLPSSGERFRFSHVLLRDKLYADLRPKARATLHFQAGTATLRGGGTPEAAVHHLFEGQSAGTPARVAEVALSAAHASLSRLAFEDAVQLGRRALQLPSADELPELLRAELEVVVAEGLILLGDSAEGKAMCARAASRAQGAGASELLARAALVYGTELASGTLDPQMIALLRQALAAVSDRDSSLRARLMARLAAALTPPASVDDGPEILALMREATNMARRIDDPGAVGLGGRDRRAASDVERARINVQRRLQDAIERIAQADPALGRYLSRAVDRIAAFQRQVFSSSRARFVADLLAFGVPEPRVPIPEDFMRLSEQEKRGREVYESACSACHGGVSTDRIEQREVVDFLFPELKPDGNVLFDVAPGRPPTPVRKKRPGVNFMNAGFQNITYFAQIGLAPSFNDSVDFPRYRFRFYEDGTRKQAVVDLPPKPVTVSGSPFDPRPARDANGAPIVGPNLVPQAFTTDPGRAAVTGDPADFEAFDIPQLRGVARTPPYFHDNSRETLREVVDEYSRFVLLFLQPLKLPAHPPETPGGRPEGLSPAQKDDLMTFLQRL
ncbi:MAG TPA: hypothetical protein VI072_18045 [Polyangiaceae bacterium]